MELMLLLLLWLVHWAAPSQVFSMQLPSEAEIRHLVKSPTNLTLEMSAVETGQPAVLLSNLSISEVRQTLNQLTFNSSALTNGSAYYTLHDAEGKKIFTQWYQADQPTLQEPTFEARKVPQYLLWQRGEIFVPGMAEPCSMQLLRSYQWLNGVSNTKYGQSGCLYTLSQMPDQYLPVHLADTFSIVFAEPILEAQSDRVQIFEGSNLLLPLVSPVSYNFSEILCQFGSFETAGKIARGGLVCQTDDLPAMTYKEPQFVIHGISFTLAKEFEVVHIQTQQTKDTLRVYPATAQPAQLLLPGQLRINPLSQKCSSAWCEYDFNDQGQVVLPTMLDSPIWYQLAQAESASLLSAKEAYVYAGEWARFDLKNAAADAKGKVEACLFDQQRLTPLWVSPTLLACKVDADMVPGIYTVSIPTAQNSVLIHVIPKPTLTRVLNPYRTSPVLRLHAKNIRPALVRCHFSNGQATELTKISTDLYQCPNPTSSTGATSLDLVDPHLNSLLSSHILLLYVPYLSVPHQLTYTGRVIIATPESLPPQTRCVNKNSNQFLPTVLNQTHVECGYAATITLALDSVEISNVFQVTHVKEPYFTVPHKVVASSQLSFNANQALQDRRSHVCKLMISYAVLHSDTCSFVMPGFHLSAVYDAKLWIEALEVPLSKFAETDLVVVHIGEQITAIAINETAFAVQGTIPKDLRVSYECMAENRVSTVLEQGNICVFPRQVESITISLTLNGRVLSTAPIVQDVTYTEVSDFEVSRESLKVVDFWPKVWFADRVLDLHLKVAHNLKPRQQYFCKVNEIKSVVAVAYEEDLLRCELPQMMPGRYQVKLEGFVGESASFELVVMGNDQVGIQVEPAYLTSYSDQFTVLMMPDKLLTEVSCFVDGAIIQPLNQVLGSHVTCSLSTQKLQYSPSINLGIHFGGSSPHSGVTFAQPKSVVPSSAFEVTEYNVYMQGTSTVHFSTSKDFPNSDISCHLESPSANFTTSPRNSVCTFHNTHLDSTDPATFTLLLLNQKAFSKQLSVQPPKYLKDFTPRFVFPYTPFTLRVEHENLDYLTIEGKKYQIHNNLVYVPDGISETVLVDERVELFAVDFVPSKQVKLIQHGVRWPLHNQTHLLKNVWCRQGHSNSTAVFSTDGLCEIKRAGPLWVSFDQLNWFLYAEVTFQDPCRVDRTVYQVGDEVQTSEIADYCVINETESCVGLRQTGKSLVSIKTQGWYSQETGLSYGVQSQVCGEIEVFEVNVTSVHPQYIIRDYTNQDLHIYGTSMAEFDLKINGDPHFNSVKVISPDHGFIRLPLIQSKRSQVEFDFFYKGVRAYQTVTLPLIDPPTFTEQPYIISTTLKQLVLPGLNLFSELDIECRYDQTGDQAVLTSVYLAGVQQEYVICPLPTMAGTLNLYSKALAQYLAHDIRWQRVEPAKLVLATTPLQAGTQLRIQLTFDQDMLQKVYRKVVVILLDHHQYECLVTDQTKPTILECLVIPQTEGQFSISVKHLSESEQFYKQDRIMITVVPKPFISQVLPEVILPYKPESVEIRGDFSPLTITKVVFNGVIQIDPVYTEEKGVIRVQAPISNPQNYLRVQLETRFGELSNSFFVRYVDHLQIKRTSTNLVYIDLPDQSIYVEGTKFDRQQSFTFRLTSATGLLIDLPAYRLSSTVLELSMDSETLSQLTEEMTLTLQVGYSTSSELYFVDELLTVKQPVINFVSPQRVNLGYHTEITVYGQWPQTTQQLLVRIDEEVTVEASQKSRTTLTFFMPKLESQKEVLTLQVSADFGRVWSDLLAEHYTTGSKQSLFPEPIPEVTNYHPKSFLRTTQSTDYTVILTGYHLSKLTQCTGILHITNDTSATCTIKITTDQRNSTFGAQSDLQTFEIGQVQVLDLQHKHLRRPYQMESVIKTDFALNLRAKEDGDYILKPTEAVTIVDGIFGDDLLPVITVYAYTLSVQSVHFYIAGEPLKISGLGLNETDLQCRASGTVQWYEVEARSATSATCYLEYSAGFEDIEIRALGVNDKLSTRLKVAEKPVITSFTKPTVDTVNLGGNGLVPHDQSDVYCTHIAAGQTDFHTLAQINKDNGTVTCQMPRYDKCQAGSIMLTYYGVHNIQSNIQAQIPPNFQENPTIENYTAITLHHAQAGANFTFKFADYVNCYQVEDLLCHFTTETVIGVIEWPFGICPVPKVQVSQSLQVELGGILVPKVMTNVIKYDLGLQILSVQPSIFVLDHSDKVKILLTKNAQITCTFTTITGEQYFSQSTSIHHGLRTCQVPSIESELSLTVWLDGSQLPMQKSQTLEATSLRVIAMPQVSVSPLVQLTPTTALTVTSSQKDLFDTCLFYKYGKSVEQPIAQCKPPAYTTDLQLHVVNSEAYIPVGQVKIITPSLTHVVITQHTQDIFTVQPFYSDQWPSWPSDRLCMQQIDQQIFVSTEVKSECSITLPQGKFWVQQGAYKTNSIFLSLDDVIPINDEPQSKAAVKMHQIGDSILLSGDAINIFEGNSTFSVLGANLIPSTELTLDGSSLKCDVISKVEASCSVSNLKPGTYRISATSSSSAELVVHPHTWFVPLAPDGNLIVFRGEYIQHMYDGYLSCGEDCLLTYHKNAIHVQIPNQLQHQGPLVLVYNQSLVVSSPANYTAESQDEVEFTVTPLFTTCEAPWQEFHVTFKTKKRPTKVNKYYDLVYSTEQEASVQLPCDRSQNLTSLEVEAGSWQVSVLQARKFTELQLINSTLVWLDGERTHEFQILVPYFDQPVEMVSQNLYRCLQNECPAFFTVSEVPISNKLVSQSQLEPLRLLTREVRLGYSSQIEILGATQSCVIGDKAVFFFLQFQDNHLRMICTVTEDHAGLQEVRADGKLLGVVQIVQRPTITNSDLLVLYSPTIVELVVQNLPAEPVECLIQHEKRFVSTFQPLSQTETEVECQVSHLAPGKVYIISLGHNSERNTANTKLLWILPLVKISSVKPALIYQIRDQKGRKVTLQGDFSSLSNQDHVDLRLSGVALNITQVASNQVTADINDIHLFDPTLRHTITLLTQEYVLAEAEIGFAPEIEVLGVKPEYVLQQQPSDVEVTIEARQAFSVCFHGASPDNLVSQPNRGQSCVLPQRSKYLAIGSANGIASRTVQIHRRNIAITHASQDLQNKLTVHGTGLNLLTHFGYGLTCLVYNENAVLIETAVAFSITNQLLECQLTQTKENSYVELTSEYAMFNVTTSRVKIQLPTLVSSGKTVHEGNFTLYETGAETFVESYDLPIVNRILPRGFYHYAESLKLTIVVEPYVGDVKCVYGESHVTRAVKTMGNFECTLDLSGMAESILIRDGLTFSVGMFETSLTFVKAPQISQVSALAEGVQLTGRYFWHQSQCVLDGVPLPTTFVDPERLLCQASNIRGSWQVTSNSWQFSDRFDVFPNFFKVKESWPLAGMTHSNNTKLTIKYETNVTTQDLSLWCNFANINKTRLTLISDSEAYCLVPTSRFSGVVDISIEVGRDLDLMYTRAQPQWRYFDNIEDLYLNRRIVTVGHELSLIGRNFLPSFSYELCCSNHTSGMQYCFDTSYESSTRLQVSATVPKQFTRFALRVRGNLTQHEWLFNSTLVVLDKPEILGQQVTQLTKDKVVVDFVIRNFYQHMLPVTCRQDGGSEGKAWITQTNPLSSIVRCTDLTYGTGKIVVAELELPFAIEDWIEPHVNSVTPVQMLLGYPSYVFDVTGQYDGDVICLFSREDGTQVFSSYVRQSQCFLNMTTASEESDLLLVLSLWEGKRNTKLYETVLSFSASYGPHLTSISPTWLYKQSYIRLTGFGFKSSCDCVFGASANISSPAEYVSETEALCFVRSLHFVGTEVIGGQVTQVALKCKNFEVTDPQVFFLRDIYTVQPEFFVDEYSRELVVEGDQFITGLKCLLTVGGLTTETDSVYISDKRLACPIEHREDLFVERHQTGTLQIKHYHPDNMTETSLSQESQVHFIARPMIWHTGQHYIADVNQTIEVAANMEITEATCQLKSHDSYYFSNFVPSEAHFGGLCFMPQILGEVETIELALRFDDFGGSKYSYTNWFSFTLIQKSYITSLWPVYTPSFEAQTITVYGGNLRPGNTVNFANAMNLPLAVVSETEATFVTPENYGAGVYTIQLFNTIHLNMVTRPHIDKLVPDHISQLGTHVITLVGQGFTTYTQCYIDEYLEVTTVWMTPELIQCTVSPQDLLADQHKVYADMQIRVFVEDRLSYRSNDAYLRMDAKTYIYKLEPTILATDTREVKVFVSEHMNRTYQYCRAKASETQAQFVKVLRTETITVTCPEVPLLESGVANHYVLPPDCGQKAQVYVCEFTLSAGTYEVEMMDQSGDFSDTQVGANTLTVFDRPSLANVRVPALPIDTDSVVEIQGAQFPDGEYTFECVFSKKFGHRLFRGPAVRVDSGVVNCNLVEMGLTSRQFVAVQVIISASDGTEYLVQETINFIVYPVPKISQVVPNTGIVTGGTKVLLHGTNFDISLGGIYCKFGNQVVEAQIVNQGHTLLCYTPAQTTAHTADIALSLNNQENFHVTNTFRYLPQTLTIKEVTPYAQDYYGLQTYEIVGENFPSERVSSVYCAFQFTDQVDFITVGQVFSSEKILCSPQSHFGEDENVQLKLSFNGQQYHDSVSTLKFYTDNRLRYNMTVFQDIHSETMYSDILAQQAINWQCPMVHVNPGKRYQQVIVATLYQDLKVLINITNSSLLETFTEAQFFSNLHEINLSPKQLEFQIGHSVWFKYYNEKQHMPLVEIYEQLFGVYNWLVSQKASIGQCNELDELSMMLTVKLYDDPSEKEKDAQTSLMTCQVGTDLLQADISRNDTMTLECLQPRYSVHVEPPKLLTQVKVVEITPSHAFIDDANITTYVEVEMLYNVSTLVCRWQLVEVPGVYVEIINHEDNSMIGKRIKCTISSFLFLQVENSVPLPDKHMIDFEVSLDGGRTFSESGKQFQILARDQFINKWPRTGPHSGGTVIYITLLDFPIVNSQVPASKCLFPGFEDDENRALGVVEAVHINTTTVSCTTPALPDFDKAPLAVEQGTLIDQHMYVMATVGLKMLDYKHVYDFKFVYIKPTSIYEILPQNIYFAPNQEDTTRRVLVLGTNFLPLKEEIYCKLTFDTIEKEFKGVYVNNYTIACDLPHPETYPVVHVDYDGEEDISLHVPLSISFNGKQQYNDPFTFYYSPQDSLVKIYPEKQYVTGNTEIKAVYNYFFDVTYKNAVCKFEQKATDENGNPVLQRAIMQILKHEYNETAQERYVVCMIPPAYVVAAEFALEGGTVEFSISSNGQDFSNTLAFQYLRVVEISDVTPRYVPMDENINMTVRGDGFYKNNFEDLLWIRLTRILVEPTDEAGYYEVRGVYHNDSCVSFIFPSDVFHDKDWLTVEITFDYITWAMSDDVRIVVVKRPILTQVRPLYSYVGRENNEIFLTGGFYPSSEKGGDFWDTALYEYLWCKFESLNFTETETQYTQAYFVNKTLVGCPLPVFNQRQTVEVDLTFDNKVYYTKAPIRIYIVDTPAITSLNNTDYYYVYKEQVYIELTGQNFYQTDKIYVKVGDTAHIANKTDETSDANGKVVLRMPLYLLPGDYSIQVSTDGVWYVPETNAPTVTINECPDGNTCTQEEVLPCPKGYFCSANDTANNIRNYEALECPLGSFQESEGSTTCEVCRNETYCPNINLKTPRDCPIGWVCPNQAGLYSLVHLQECPAGYYCPHGTTYYDASNLNFIIPEFGNQTAPGNMYPCPDGFYCPKGTSDFFSIQGNFTTPQVCKDGYICSQNKFYNKSIDLPGSIDQFGISKCLPGHSCVNGNATKCPEGFKCPDYGLAAPERCQPGTYANTNGTAQCDLCPAGTFCFFSGMNNPIKCKPGYTCQLEGSPFPSQLCPAGSFCQIAVLTNFTNSTIDERVKPIQCLSSTYCLAGAYTPYVDPTNPQAAQECIAGTFCEAGSNSPEGKGKCKKGYYCPANANEMKPTDPGYFAEGTGNVDQEECRPGTYQDERQQESCKECPIGAFCPETKMVMPYLCPPGTFAQSKGLTQCSNCPLGTYSDETGLTIERDCKKCEANYVCTQTGLSSMQKAQGCQEGYQCEEGTTTTKMLNSKVETGFYGDVNISARAQYKLCEKGNYCPPGTAATKVKQLDCLKGYFCPWGTAGELNLEGRFYDEEVDGHVKVHQVDIKKFRQEIAVFVNETTKAVQEFERRNRTNKLEDTLRSLRDKKTKGGNLSPEELKTYEQLDWEFYKYFKNLTTIQERIDYIYKIDYNDTPCAEDSLLPIELKTSYIQNGKNLKCPRGTESERRSWCLGQCKIESTNKAPQAIMDPITAVINVSSLAEGDVDVPDGQISTRLLKDEQIQVRDHMRKLQALNAKDRDFDVIKGEINDTLRVLPIKPLEIAKIYIDFTELPDLLNYNEHFAITIQNEEGREYQLPYYFDPQNDLDKGNTRKNVQLVIRIFNFMPEDKYFKVGIKLYHALFLPYLEQLVTKFHIEMSSAQRQLRGTNQTYAFILNEAQMEGTTMPYNSVDYGDDPDLWIDFVSLAPGVNMTHKNLDKDAFDNTYWQSKQINSVVMPWIPFFSNCDGSDTRIIPFDIFEYTENTEDSFCTLPAFEDLRVVNPIPTNGFEPVADRCTLNLKCRYDEDLSYLRSTTFRWFEILEPKPLFFMTQSPAAIEDFVRLENSDTRQTFFNTLIEDGSDELLPVMFYPEIETPGVPRLVEIDFLYYQKTTTEKIVQSMSVYLREYDGLDRNGMSRDEIDINYTMRINYVPLSYFNLINNFQFSVPIYIVLFMMISSIVILSIIIFWLITLTFVKSTDPPALRFFQLAKITFKAPSNGCLVSVVPVCFVVLLLRAYQQSALFADQPDNWLKVGIIMTVKDVVNAKRGRIGLAFVIFGLIFLHFGSNAIIHKPSEPEEREIIAQKKKYKRIEEMEMSQEALDAEKLFDEETHEKEESINIRRALDWKRRHFFVCCLLISIVLVLKMEYSYTKIFQNNIQYFLVMFLFIDIVNEQLLTRLIMSEALLVAPLQSTIQMTEFVMTMGANDFKAFLLSYVIDTTIVVLNRTYIGPLVERIEALTQVTFIKMAKRFEWFRNATRNILVKQMAAQMQLMSLNEFQRKKRIREDLNPNHVPNQFEWQMERGEGLEALLGSVMQYASQTQAVFTIPWLLLLIIQFANETKIAQSYQIRQGDLWYYLTFTIVTIVPQLTVDVFLLHILEMTHGYRTYDYLTYCNYRVNIRTRKWLSSQTLDKSINHLFRSVDGLCFGSQFYFITSLTSWGILMLYLGFTTMIRAQYNPFADPTLIYWVIGLPMITWPVKVLLGYMAEWVGLWKVTGDDRITIDIGTINRLDNANNMKRLLQNITTNPFRNKFIIVNREWLVNNLAMILGGRSIGQRQQGTELEYLNKVYQSAVNSEVVQEHLKKKQAKLRQKQMMLPYNQQANLDKRVEVSEDSVSDVLVRDWDLPDELAKAHCNRIIKMWLDFARQQLRLKFMVADIVLAQIKRKCQKCKSRFRLQVIQKIDFNAICEKFRQQNQGLAFTKQRWRNFYKRRQIYETLCMECAYIQTLKAAHLKSKNPELQNLMAQNALKQVGQKDVMVSKKLKLKSVKQITYRWVWLARGQILHKENLQDKIKREHRQRLLAMNLDREFMGNQDINQDKQDDTLGLF